MKLSKVFKLLICFVLIIPMFFTNASANTNYNHDELMQYEGYGKAMYESIVEQTTFITGQYTDNKEYVSESINEIKDYASFWRDQLVDEENCAFDSAPFSCIGSMVERGGAYVLTVGDWIKNLFSDYDEELAGSIESEHPMAAYFVPNVSADRIDIVKGYYFTLDDNTDYRRSYMSLGSGITGYPSDGYNGYIITEFDIVGLFGYRYFSQIAERDAERDKFLGGSTNVGVVLGYASQRGLTIYKSDDNTLVPSLSRPREVNPITKYINENGVPPVVVPSLKPSLVCPDGTKISMDISGSTFLSVNDEVMMVNKDGTAQVNGQLCNLNWQKPEVKYLDDKVVVEDLTDSEGNFEDVLCLLGPANCQPISKEEAAVEKVDKSLLQYVKNAYEYGTGVLKTATDGLKSLATGAKDLTSLFGTFFSWLPSEMVVLMASGLGITVGLRLFRK